MLGGGHLFKVFQGHLCSLHTCIGQQGGVGASLTCTGCKALVVVPLHAQRFAHGPNDRGMHSSCGLIALLKCSMHSQLQHGR